MKIMLYRDGKTGVAARLPGEHVEVELTDLLGGETEMTAITSKLCVVTLEDGKELGLMQNYEVHRLGRAPMPVYGDCAVIALNIDGTYRDMNLVEVAAAGGYVRCV